MTVTGSLVLCELSPLAQRVSEFTECLTTLNSGHYHTVSAGGKIQI